MSKNLCTCGNEKDARSAQCQRCHCVEIAPMGYKAVVAKYGEKYAVKCLKAYLDAHPSSLEAKVMGWLNELGLDFSTNFWIDATHKGKHVVYLVDFAIVNPKTNSWVYLEVNGDYVHQFHAERDQRKLRCLRRRKNDRVVVLDTTAVTSGSGRDLLQAALQ